MSKKLTPWFPVSIKPVRDGWYEARYNFCNDRLSRSMRYFKDGKWLISDTFLMSSLFGNTEPFPGEAWRGLAEPPK